MRRACQIGGPGRCLLARAALSVRLHLPARPERAGGAVSSVVLFERGRYDQLMIAREGSGHGACARVRLTQRLPSHATCPAGHGSARVARCDATPISTWEALTS